MNYTKEAREVTRSMYGGYCAMCKQLEIAPVYYHQFSIKEYDRVKELFKEINK